MKTKNTIVFIAVAAMFISNAHATIRTVSNSPSTIIAQFNTIQAAIDASTSGDTIYVHGSPVNYAGFGISNMRLVIIGPGWSPDKTQAFTANVAGFDITGTGSTGTEIQGIVCTGNINIKPSHPDSLRFIRNKFGNGVQLNVNQNSTTYSGFLFEGNVFSLASVNATSGSVYRNFVFQNNIFTWRLFVKG